MKKTIAAILTLALFLICLSATALAASSVYISGDANVRTGPGLDYGSLGSVNAGSTLDYLGSTQYDGRGVAWYYVSFSGGAGWVYSRYASLTNYSGSATYGGGASGGSYSDNTGYYGGSVYASGDVNVRTGPGLGYGSIGTLYAGRSASYLGSTSYDDRGVAWYQISFNGRTGWVSSAYASLY